MELRASIEDKKRIQDLKKSVNRFGDILRFFMHGGMELLIEKMYQARKCSFCFVHVLHETTLFGYRYGLPFCRFSGKIKYKPKTIYGRVRHAGQTEL